MAPTWASRVAKRNSSAAASNSKRRTARQRAQQAAAVSLGRRLEVPVTTSESVDVGAEQTEGEGWDALFGDMRDGMEFEEFGFGDGLDVDESETFEVEDEGLGLGVLEKDVFQARRMDNGMEKARMMYKVVGEAKELEEVERMEESDDESDTLCFRLMDLPAEIRLEIYRACLTRPYNVLLSKVEQSLPFTTNKTLGRSVSESMEEHRQRALAAYDVARALPPTIGGQQRRIFGSTPVQQDNEDDSVRLVPINNRRGHPRPGSARLVSTSQPAPPRQATTLATSSSSSSSSSSSFSTTTPTRTPATAIRKRNYASPADPLIIRLLRVSKQVYKEARDVLYSENIFTLNLETAVPTLACLHQRSRRHIKYIEVEIPTYTEIIERFSEVVRLSLRYCSGLRRFVVHTPFLLPGAEGGLGSNHGTVYANGFDILRWLPQQCEVVLKGTRNLEIEAVVGKHLMLAKAQDKESWATGQYTNSLGARNLWMS